MTTRAAAAIFIVALLALAVTALVTMDGLATALIVGLIVMAPSVWLCRRLDRKLGLGLVSLFLLALTLRWCTATFVHFGLYASRPGLFAPDEIHYDLVSRLYALYLQGRGPDPNEGELPRTLVLMASGCYYLFGFHLIIPKLLVGIIGAWTAVLTAILAREFTSVAAARRAGLLAAVFPSLVLWSSLLIKDTNTLCGTQLALLAFIRMRQRFSLRWLALFVVALAWVANERPYEVIFVGLAVAASALVSPDRQMVRKLALFVVVSSIVLYIIRRSAADTVALGTGDVAFMDRLANIRSGYATGVGSAINVNLIDTRSLGGLVLWIPIGLVYFFLAPLPFTGGTIISMATSPEMLVVYALLPSLWRGMKMALKERSKAFLTLFLYCIVSSVGWAMVITNVGTIYRYRAQIFHVLLMMIAIDQTRRIAAGQEPRAVPGSATTVPPAGTLSGQSSSAVERG